MKALIFQFLLSIAVLRNYSVLALTMEAAGIVPDVIDVAPTNSIEVVYDSGVNVDQGKEFTPAQVKNEPVKVLWPIDDGAYYTLAMIDPDAPSRVNPTRREILHWLVINIPANDVKQGQIIASYRGAGPPEGGGLHRYVILAYKQPDGKIVLNDTQLATIATGNFQARVNFSIRKFSDQYKLGRQPSAGNYFQSQYHAT